MFVIAFRHDTDHRFGARLAHKDAPVSVEAGPTFLDALFHTRVLKRRSLAEAHVLHNLR